jgi:ATP-dependent Clp protease protease subunit
MRRNKSPFNRSAPDLKIVRNEQADEAEILVYDEIGFWGIQAAWTSSALSPRSTRRRSSRPDQQPGRERVRRDRDLQRAPRALGHVITHVDSLAASIASVIALAGDEVKIAKNAY